MLKPSILLGLAVGFAGTAAFCAHGTEDQSINWWGLGSRYQESPALGWYFLTFVIFVAGLIYAIKKPLGLYLETRSKDIQASINEAKIAKEEATKKLQAYQDRLAQLDGEIVSMKEEFAKQGELEKAQLKKSAEQMAAQITKDSQDMIAGEIRRAMYDLKQEVAVKIIASVTQEMKDRANVQTESLMREEFARDVGKLMH